jgi:hypothetical protein
LHYLQQLQAPLEHQALLGHKEFRVLLDLQVQQDLQDQLALKEHKVYLEQTEQMVLMVQ